MPNIILPKLCFLSFLLFVNKTFAQSPVLNRCDGPYLFYKDNKILIKSIDRNNNLVLDSFFLSERAAHKLQIQFSNHEGWNFTVTLRKSIRPEPPEYKTPSKIFALSDIEGEFENFRALLIAGQVMDSLYNWTFGTGHFVICGDLFDRGNDVVPELWLLYKLEDEARTKGGYVHTLLGNHDIMNLSGDLRYVQPQYFDHAKLMEQNYMDLYGPDTELGRWLRSKNIIEKIGDNLYLHGGIAPEILAKKMTVPEINNACRPFYDQSKHPESFTGHEELLPFFGRNALFWYRGYFMDPRASQSFVDSTLAFYHCRHIIVGHTITGSDIVDYYNHKVIALDVDEHEGHSEAIIVDHGRLTTIDKAGAQNTMQPGPQHPVVQ